MNSYLEDVALNLERRFYLPDDRRHQERLRDLEVLNRSPGLVKELLGDADEEVLNALGLLGMKATVHMALQLSPLIAAAWASGKVVEKEYQAILDRLENSIFGLRLGRELVEAWLERKLPPDFLAEWEAFMERLKGCLSPQVFTAYGRLLVDPALGVMKSSGGFFGFMALTRKEKRLLLRLRRATRP